MPKTPNQVNTWQIVVAIMTVIIAVAVLTVQWQSSVDATASLRADVEELNVRHEQDNDKLIEQNRERRAAVAELESRIAVLEATK